jgi:hypothetical protein
LDLGTNKPQKFGIGDLVRVRGREWVIVAEDADAGLPRTLDLACLDDDAQGERLRIVLGSEIDLQRVEGRDYEAACAHAQHGRLIDSRCSYGWPWVMRAASSDIAVSFCFEVGRFFYSDSECSSANSVRCAS